MNATRKDAPGGNHGAGKAGRFGTDHITESRIKRLIVRAYCQKLLPLKLASWLVRLLRLGAS